MCVDNIKRATSPYGAFVADYYKQSGSSLQGVSAAKSASDIGAKWKALSESAKGAFYEIAAKDKERYHKEVAEFKATLPPKRPATSYLRYFNEVRGQLESENQGSTLTEIAKLAGSNWKKLSESEKQKYKDAYSKEKAEYDAKYSTSK